MPLGLMVRTPSNGSKPKSKLKSSRIWRLIQRRDWDNVRLLLKSCAGKGHNLSIRTDFTGTLTVFLYTLQFDPPLDIVQTMVESYPGVLSDEDYGGRLPLHVACHHSSSFEVVNFFLKEYPRSATWHDARGRIPLHYATARACRGARDKSANKASKPKQQQQQQQQKEELTRQQLQIIGSLLLAAPASVLTVDDDGLSSVDIAEALMMDPKRSDSNNAACIVYDTLRKVSESVLLVQDVKGATTTAVENISVENEMRSARQSYQETDGIEEQK